MPRFEGEYYHYELKVHPNSLDVCTICGNTQGVLSIARGQRFAMREKRIAVICYECLSDAKTVGEDVRHW